jgi:hypothetical protein
MPASVELVKIALRAYADGYSEIALALADPLIRWDERASRPDGELVWNHAEVERAMRRYHEGWRQYSFELEEVAEVTPGKVVGICRERGVDGNGVSVDRRFGGLWIVENAKIVSWSTYLTPKEAVRAAKERGTGSQRFRGPQAPAAPAAPVKRPSAADEQKRRAARARARAQRQRAAS